MELQETSQGPGKGKPSPEPHSKPSGDRESWSCLAHPSPLQTPAMVGTLGQVLYLVVVFGCIAALICMAGGGERSYFHSADIRNLKWMPRISSSLGANFGTKNCLYKQYSQRGFHCEGWGSLPGIFPLTVLESKADRYFPHSENHWLNTSWMYVWLYMVHHVLNYHGDSAEKIHNILFPNIYQVNYDRVSKKMMLATLGGIHSSTKMKSDKQKMECL